MKNTKLLVVLMAISVVFSVEAKDPETQENTKDIVGYYHKRVCNKLVEFKQATYQKCIENKALRRDVGHAVQVSSETCDFDSKCTEAQIDVFAIELTQRLSYR